MGEFQDAVRQRGLAVIDVSDDREISNAGWLGRSRWLVVHFSPQGTLRRADSCLASTGRFMRPHRFPKQTQQVSQTNPARKFPFVANIKSQIKRNRQTEKRRISNRGVSSELKTREKAVMAAAEAGEPTDELYSEAQKRLDMAATKGVIHRKEASRRKSRLAARLRRTDS